MAKIESSAVSYSLECLYCDCAWVETVDAPLERCPQCGAAVEESSGTFRVAPDHSAAPSSEAWGWAAAMKTKA
jgi:hypothetical protein